VLGTFEPPTGLRRRYRKELGRRNSTPLQEALLLVRVIEQVIEQGRDRPAAKREGKLRTRQKRDPMRFFVPPVLVGGLRRTEARDEAETGAGLEGGVERGGAAWGGGTIPMPWAGGRRGAAGGLARLLLGSPFLPTRR